MWFTPTTTATTPTRDIQCTLGEDGVLVIKLSRPDRLNAFTVTMADELEAAFRRASADDAVRAIVLAGEGRAFCAGMDLGGEGQANVFGLDETLQPTLTDLQQNGSDTTTARGLRDTGGRVTLAMFDCAKPVVAAIHGTAVGVGATMTLPADMRICAEGSRFGFVFGNIGIVPDACSSWFLPRIVGLPRALQWALAGNLIDAPTALASGLVDKVVSAADLLATAHAQALAFSRNRSAVSTALTRQMLWKLAAAPSPYEAHAVESLGIWHTSQSDGKEGVRAFLEKRAPQFSSRASQMPDFYPWW
jgi:enoyl-CoA hydratase/carnithine racemase